LFLINVFEAERQIGGYMRRGIRFVLYLGWVSVATGCTTVPEPEGAKVIQQGLGSTDSVSGYSHSFTNSKFHIGSNPISVAESGLLKTVGTDGVFGIVPETGWVLAIPNATSPSRLVAPLTSSPDVNNARVLDYFTSNGLPASQVGGVNAHASMYASGARDSSTPTLPAKPEFGGYTSVVTRAVSGVPVPDSFAWARFNADGEVVAEQVYWPALPSTVVNAASALAARLSDPVVRDNYLRQLPSGASNGQVVIRHSACSYRGGFEAMASYDFTTEGESPRVRHFDASGAEVTLKSEASAPPPPTTK
jgi:hypothetical protein